MGKEHETASWRPIESAPRNGTPVKVRRVYDGRVLFEGVAEWRRVEFRAFINGRHGVEPAYQAEGWMHHGRDKRFPEPTHWQEDTHAE